MKKNCISLIVLVTVLMTISSYSQQKKVKGTVFLDQNENGLYDKGERGIANVALSNGRDVVLTNKNGDYKIKVENDQIVFLIKPSGYIPKLSEDFVQQAYQVNKPNGSPNLHFKGAAPTTIQNPLNFPLYKNAGEDTLKIGLIGDTQTKTIDDVYYLSKVVAEKMMDEEYDFLVPLGDITYDNLRLFEPIKDVLGKVQAPVYYVYGNHDRNYDGKDLKYRDETYENSFGPSYYAFNYGSHSFIALNNVFPKPHHNYEARLDDDQLKFIEGYLSTVPQENDVHLLMHIPLEQLINLKEFSQLFKNHPKVHAYAGHTHTQFFETIKNEDGWSVNAPVEELVAGAVCGSWWHGEKDIFGIPQAMMSDGTPKGYWVMHLQADEKKYEYKVSEPDNRQMHIWTPFDFDRELIDFEERKIVANVYAGNKNTEVQIKIGDGDWLPMNYVEGFDPFYERLFTLQKNGVTLDQNTLKIGKPRKSYHLWEIPIPKDLESGIHLIQVRASNDYGLDVEGRSMLFNNTNNEQYFIPKKKKK
ncbi:calcineurin-like phosphoesterase C-terminal domain-containing protein [Galbibacter mesophilus]|uniref:calcineurin-like phosphoesterase C-terminal domain-containing protein n=1 Tax=Galbibacter mesophilus TaxID=379069 RepID=UPI00191DFD9C|nr:calcineurin-like phosphoesterase C-terminal domain-containing protein [Galbibacter mesophilus]MCM5662298.1 calcineurin-like phosphoesterase C-terminal domain-containing protein [Galbibacter mesophilus]